MWDYHVHSSFSDDCHVEMETIVQKGISLGIKEICFTDHIDYEAAIPNVIIEFDNNDYSREVNRLGKKYRDKISIKKGVEMGFQPHILDKCNKFILDGDFDFVLCSLHTVENKDVYLGDLLKDNSPKEAYEKYFQELYYCIEKGAIFSVLAHFDLLKRHVDYPFDKVFRENFDIIEGIFKKVIYDGKGLEVNTSGFRYKLESPLPSKDLLIFYKELGGEIITLGSDSHGENTLGYNFPYTYELLKNIGFKYLTIYDKMRPQFIKIP